LIKGDILIIIFSSISILDSAIRWKVCNEYLWVFSPSFKVPFESFYASFVLEKRTTLMRRPKRLFLKIP